MVSIFDLLFRTGAAAGRSWRVNVAAFRRRRCLETGKHKDGNFRLMPSGDPDRFAALVTCRRCGGEYVADLPKTAVRAQAKPTRLIHVYRPER
jgi:hypothetical protein